MIRQSPWRIPAVPVVMWTEAMSNEHLALSNVEDVKQGIIASKIVANDADIAKKILHARDIDDKMADARRMLERQQP